MKVAGVAELAAMAMLMMTVVEVCRRGEEWRRLVSPSSSLSNLMSQCLLVAFRVPLARGEHGGDRDGSVGG
jgi:hypothetical protein